MYVHVEKACQPSKCQTRKSEEYSFDVATGYTQIISIMLIFFLLGENTENTVLYLKIRPSRPLLSHRLDCD